MREPLDHDDALQEVLAFLAHPPAPDSDEDLRFGARLRQVLAVSAPLEGDDEEDQPVLTVPADLRRSLEAVARARSARHPFGEHPDGIGPTLGMDLGRP